jgi:hypothetical protein
MANKDVPTKANMKADNRKNSKTGKSRTGPVERAVKRVVKGVKKGAKSAVESGGPAELIAKAVGATTVKDRVKAKKKKAKSQADNYSNMGGSNNTGTSKKKKISSVAQKGANASATGKATREVKAADKARAKEMSEDTNYKPKKAGKRPSISRKVDKEIAKGRADAKAKAGKRPTIKAAKEKDRAMTDSARPSIAKKNAKGRADAKHKAQLLKGAVKSSAKSAVTGRAARGRKY